MNKLSRPKIRYNRLCAEEAIARGKKTYMGWCAHHHKVLRRIHPEKHRWFTECTICVANHLANLYTRKSKDAEDLERKRRNRAGITKAIKDGKNRAMLECKYHGLGLFSVQVNIGGKRIKCKKCEQLQKRHKLDCQQNRETIMHQWVVMDEAGRTPPPVNFKLPLTDSLMVKAIGQDQVLIDSDLNWPLPRLRPLYERGNDPVKLLITDLVLKPYKVEEYHRETTHVLAGAAALVLPKFCEIHVIHVVRIKNSDQIPLPRYAECHETYTIPAKYVLHSESEYFRDGLYDVKMELYVLKNYVNNPRIKV